MSHFYGTLQGHRGQATRCGSKESGIDAVAASWEGSVRVYAFQRDGRDYVRIAFDSWHGAGRELTLYYGPINPTNDEVLNGLSLDRLGLGPLGKQAILAAAAD